MPAFLDAAYQVLKEMDSPMSAEEITQQALDRGLLITRGVTPAATMSASLYMDIKEKGIASRFIQVGPNRFTINGGSQPLLELDTKPKLIINKTSKRTELVRADPSHKLFDHEIALIRAFLRGQSPQSPTSEKICDWVTLCYTFGLYSEGVDLFGFIDPLEVNEWYYTRTKKLARLCALHQGNNSKEGMQPNA